MCVCVHVKSPIKTTKMAKDGLLPSVGGEEMAGLCSVPLGIQNNNDERPNKNESKTKTVSLSSSKEGTEISSSKSEKRFSKLYPYGSVCMKPKSLHNISSGNTL